MKEYEHGPRTTEEAHNALQRLIGPDWRKAALTIPVDQVRDPDCVLMDVITERDILRMKVGAVDLELDRLRDIIKNTLELLAEYEPAQERIPQPPPSPPSNPQKD